jgi:hypothetical protein
VEKFLAGETEILLENLPQCRSVYHRSLTTQPGPEPLSMIVRSEDRLHIFIYQLNAGDLVTVRDEEIDFIYLLIY